MSDVNPSSSSDNLKPKFGDEPKPKRSGKDKHNLWLKPTPSLPSISIEAAEAFASPTTPTSPTSHENLEIPNQVTQEPGKQHKRKNPVSLLKDSGKLYPKRPLSPIPEASTSKENSKSQTPSAFSNMSSVFSNMSSRPSSSGQSEISSGSDHSANWYEESAEQPQQFMFPNPTEAPSQAKEGNSKKDF